MPPFATLDDFELGEEVAWGSLATIIDAVYKKNNKHYALKVLNKVELLKKKGVRSATVEKDALIALGTRKERHPGIVRLHHSFTDSNHIYFALDLATNGDLKALVQKLGSISINCSRYYTAQLVDAVIYLHNCGIVHRDIKPENILLNSEMRIMLADFGCAYIGSDMETPRTNTFVGTAAYISPELLARSKVNPTSPDLWAIGCTIYFFLFGTSPFMAATDYLTMKRVKNLDYTIPPECDKDVTDLIQQLLVLDPMDRLGVPPKSSPDALKQHPFFVGHDKKDFPEDSPELSSWAIIDWKRLWTTPAPPIEVGPYRTRPLDVPGTTDELWAGFESLQVTENSD
ncbi:AGC/PDK1 protein kinase [Pholiota conissans]|uniref:non-specific serine/threonine protein kinase n=1 Tax=Pholiota conissans TaxID=109636 RepID=A0A9P5ZE81_9AGAR|nr:AGC/PDK1 protein kinase [Pholiota conissans]